MARYLRIGFLTIVLLSQSILSWAQTDRLDSLFSILKSQTGHEKVLSYGQISLDMQEIDLDSAIYYSGLGLELAKANNDVLGLLKLYDIRGHLYTNAGEILQAIAASRSMLELAKSEDKIESEIDALCKLGEAFAFDSRYDSASTYCLKCMEMAEENDLIEHMGRAYNNYASVLDFQGQADEAIHYYKKAISCYDSDDYFNLTSIYNNLAVVYDNYNEQIYIDSALKYYGIALNMVKSLDYEFGKATIYGSFGGIYTRLRDQNKAKAYLDSSFIAGWNIGSEQRIAASYANYGLYFTEFEQFDSAEFYYLKGLKIFENMGDKYDRSFVLQSIAMMYEKLGNYKKAYKYYVDYKELSDSILNDELVETTKSLEARYQFDKQKKEIELSKQREELANAKASKEQEANKRKSAYLWFAVIGLAIVLFFVVFVVRANFKVKRARDEIAKQKLEVEEQRDIINEKNLEITDSINYAKRLQEAILPNKDELNKYIGEHFVLYLPKDIVAGDFYWHEQEGDWSYYAAADCTGHGVPGAMVSVVCANALSKAVKEEGIHEPGKILDRTRELVIAQFSKSDENIRDGMDVALCGVNKNEKKLLFSGAHNPLWLVRSSSAPVPNEDAKYLEYEDYRLYDIKADKQPVGSYESMRPFNTIEIELLEDDCLYTFSDGYPDQFGGSSGKKFKSASFKKLILSQHTNSMQEQLRILENEFLKWRGSYEQLDDVCVIGVRI